jgi:hypothetical protein
MVSTSSLVRSPVLVKTVNPSPYSEPALLGEEEWFRDDAWAVQDLKGTLRQFQGLGRLEPTRTMAMFQKCMILHALPSSSFLYKEKFYNIDC